MSAHPPAVLGLDLGTTEVKAGLVTLDGQVLALARSGYALDVGGGHGWAEQDPGAWWSAVVSAVRALRATDLAEIVAIGTDGHGPTLVAVDARGEATRPAITFLDGRSTAEAETLAAATGIGGWSLGGLPAALWVERHEPAVALATCWYLSTWEWLGLRLTGVAAAPDVPDQAVPDAALVAGAGVPSDRLPPPSVSGEVIGTLTATAADALGLRPGIPVVGGLVDAFASYLGAGLLEPGDAYDPGGSAGGFGVYWDRPLEVPGAFVTPAPLAGRYSVGAAMATTGRALDWYRDGILGDTISTEALLAEAAATPPGADGLVFLPYLAGGGGRGAGVPTASSSCRTSPASARRSGTRRHGASWPGSPWPMAAATSRAPSSRHPPSRSATCPPRCSRPVCASPRCASAADRPRAGSGTRSRPT